MVRHEKPRFNSKGRKITNPQYKEEFSWACLRCGWLGIPLGSRCPDCGDRSVQIEFDFPYS